MRSFWNIWPVVNTSLDLPERSNSSIISLAKCLQTKGNKHKTREHFAERNVSVALHTAFLIWFLPVFCYYFLKFICLFVCLLLLLCVFFFFFWGGGGVYDLRVFIPHWRPTIATFTFGFFGGFSIQTNTCNECIMQQIWTRIIGKQWVLIFILNFIGLIIIYDIYKWMKDFWVPSTIWLAKLLVEYQEIINWLALCMKTIKIYRKWENWGWSSLSYSMSFIKSFGLNPHSLSSESITDLLDTHH